MKNFEIRLTVKNPINDNKILDINIVEADDLVELCSKIPFMIIRAKEIVEEEKSRHWVGVNDDIPF